MADRPTCASTRRVTPAVDPLPRPVGFPGCRLCAYRRLERPDVCLSCLERSAGQHGVGGGRGARGGRDASERREAGAGAGRGAGGGEAGGGEAGGGETGGWVCCASCGGLRRPSSTCPTMWCGREDRGWSVVFGVGVHRAGLQRAIVRYKYGGERWWADVFARLLAGFLDRRAPWFDDFDLLVPMPAYLGVGARRSWDPVGEIVASMATIVGPLWPIGWGAITKRAETSPMTGGSRRSRQRTASRQLRPALAVPDLRAVAGARLLIVDDVLAEGSTLREVALALRRSGAREVAGLVLARPEWHGEMTSVAWRG